GGGGGGRGGGAGPARRGWPLPRPPGRAGARGCAAPDLGSPAWRSRGTPPAGPCPPIRQRSGPWQPRCQSETDVVRSCCCSLWGGGRGPGSVDELRYPKGPLSGGKRDVHDRRVQRDHELRQRDEKRATQRLEVVSSTMPFTFIRRAGTALAWLRYGWPADLHGRRSRSSACQIAPAGGAAGSGPTARGLRTRSPHHQWAEG